MSKLTRPIAQQRKEDRERKCKAAAAAAAAAKKHTTTTACHYNLDDDEDSATTFAFFATPAKIIVKTVDKDDCLPTQLQQTHQNKKPSKIIVETVDEEDCLPKPCQQTQQTNKPSKIIVETVDKEDCLPKQMQQPEHKTAMIHLTASAGSQTSIAEHARAIYNLYQLLMTSLHLQVQFMNTWQGQLPGTNATCAVNSYLAAALHLTKENPDGLPWQHGLEKIIDSIAPAIVDAIPKHFQCTGNNLFQDQVADYLVNMGGLQRHLQQNAHTQVLAPVLKNIFHGNLMGGDGLDNFLQYFTTNTCPELANNKISATIFNHQHVIFIH